MFVGDNFAANPASFTTNIPAATNLIIVGTALESRAGGRCPTAVTIGGAAATKIVDKDSDPVDDWQSCAALWYRYNPATGSSVAITVTWGVTPTEGQVFVLAVSGANTSQPPAPAQGFSGVVDPPGKQLRGDLASATTVANSWCVASTSVSSPGTIANCSGFADQVLLQQSTTTSQTGAFARRTIASAGAASMCLTQSNINRWAMAEACFAPSVAAQSLIVHGPLAQGALVAGGAQPTPAVTPNAAAPFAAPGGLATGGVPTCPSATVEADAPISARYPTTSFGASEQLGAAASPAKRTLFRVLVSGVGEQTVASVRLGLTVDGVGGAESDAGGRLHWIPDCAWDELTTTWDTQPDTTGAIFLDGKGAVAAGETVSFDVTAAIAGDGVSCFVLDSASDDEVIYRAAEAPSAGPEVQITTDGPCR
jgi:hypothetical protein